MSIKQGVRLGQEGYHFRTPGFLEVNLMVNNLEPQKNPYLWLLKVDLHLYQKTDVAQMFAQYVYFLNLVSAWY